MFDAVISISYWYSFFLFIYLKVVYFSLFFIYLNVFPSTSLASLYGHGQSEDPTIWRLSCADVRWNFNFTLISISIGIYLYYTKEYFDNNDCGFRCLRIPSTTNSVCDMPMSYLLKWKILYLRFFRSNPLYYSAFFCVLSLLGLLILCVSVLLLVKWTKY